MTRAAPLLRSGIGCDHRSRVDGRFGIGPSWRPELSPKTPDRVSAVIHRPAPSVERLGQAARASPCSESSVRRANPRMGGPSAACCGGPQALPLWVACPTGAVLVGARCCFLPSGSRTNPCCEFRPPHRRGILPMGGAATDPAPPRVERWLEFDLISDGL